MYENFYIDINPLFWTKLVCS